MELAHFTLAAQHPLTQEWCPDAEGRLARFAADHEFDLQLATDLELATRRATLAPGHAPKEMLNRWVAVSRDLSMMLSIRFEGLDPAKPFVDATVLSRPVTPEDLAALGSAAVNVFGTFGPRYLRLWSSAAVNDFAGTRRDKRFVGAPVADLATRGRTTIPEELSIAVARDLVHWDDAAAAYRAVDDKHHTHPDQSRLQDVEDLQESIEGGTLFDVLVDGTWAGWIGVLEDSSSSLGLPCYEVQELILAPGFRGRGYGTHLTTLLARELPERQRVLLGTIHADNRGALEAALRAGRRDVGGWFQLPL